MAGYRSKPVGELAKELAAGLVRLRRGYIDSAEALLRLVRPDTSYPYEFVVYRLTGYRSRGSETVEPIDGEDLRHDLPLLVLDLCAGINLPAEAYSEPAYDTAALARHFHVSTKTIQRWRKCGLLARKLVFPDGRKRIAFLAGSVRDFVDARRRTMLRSVRFSQLDDAERQDIIRRARRMISRTGCCLNDVAKRLSARTGRAMETIRYTIRRHDREHPDQAVFPGHQAPLDGAAKEVIYRCFLHGVSVTALAKRYARSRGSIYRVINEMRARQLLGRRIEFVYNGQFDLPNADTWILQDPPEPAGAKPPPKQPRVPKDLPPYLAWLYAQPLLKPVQERSLFLKYNFLKYRADQLRQGFDLNRVRTGRLRKVEQRLVQADAVKNQIIRANLRLVVSIAKKHLNGPQGLFELISDGNVSLMRAIEKFDCSRGFKFSTYASWAIMKNFARSVPRERYLLDRFITGVEGVADLAATAKSYDPHATTLGELRESLEAVLAQLSPRERVIITQHFGLGEQNHTATLEQLSRELGISKERVRQIEHRAMEKLRTMLKPVQAELMR
ncbi:MAG TPA: sigma-70 family RNA polymerase sigma factor [Phycisphaerae bacterium]|nr:sigma-70 family RNA polymerase sigma factor [Phycisphaerae bacterium]